MGFPEYMRRMQYVFYSEGGIPFYTSDHFSPYVENALGEIILRELKGKNVKILEIGCGKGKMARNISSFLSKKVKSEYVAIDWVNRGSLKPYGHFIVADGIYLPFRKNSFDLVFGNEILDDLHVDRLRNGEFDFVGIRDFVKELKRILKNNGRAIFMDYFSGKTIGRKVLMRRLYESKGIANITITPDVDRIRDFAEESGLDFELKKTSKFFRDTKSGNIVGLLIGSGPTTDPFYLPAKSLYGDRNSKIKEIYETRPLWQWFTDRDWTLTLRNLSAS